MKFSVNQKDFQNSLNYCQGVIEKRSTLPILSNVLPDTLSLIQRYLNVLTSFIPL